MVSRGLSTLKRCVEALHSHDGAGKREKESVYVEDRRCKGFFSRGDIYTIKGPHAREAFM